MGKISSKICSILYRVTGHWFPESYKNIKIGKKEIHIKCGLRYRRFLAKRIIRECGIAVNIEKYSKFSKDIHLGDYSGIGSKCSVGPKTHIGDHVMMGPEVIIYTRNHETSRVDITMDKQGFRPIQPVYIGNDVWIGRRVMIMPGVHIGDGCVLGAGCVIAKDIPPYSVVVGNPARIIKNRQDEAKKLAAEKNEE